MWNSVIKTFLISAAIPMGFSVGFFICCYILGTLKGDPTS